MNKISINVLLIEDNPSDARLIEELLKESNRITFKLTSCNRLSKGLEHLKSQKHDVVLLDLSLPDSFGIDTVLNTIETAPSVPVIIMTGTDIDDIAIESVKEGAQDYLVKGQVDSTNLIRSIQYAIQRKELEEKLKESEENIRIAYDQANFYKDLFAHDINNILNNIQMAISLSSNFIDDPAKIKNLKEMYQIISDQIVRGIKLVSNVQKLSKLEESKITLENVEVSEVLKDSIKIIDRGFQPNKVKIQIDAPSNDFIILANELLLDVFENILMNAVKYNDNPITVISVRISEEQRDELNYVKIEFVDNGIGITDEMKVLIFQRGHLERKGGKGLGFGLSLVKKIIESYNGKIWVEDRVKGDYRKGSNFILLIPKVEK